MKWLVVSSAINPRSGEYDAYLRTHISNVMRSWDDILKPVVLDYPNAPMDVDLDYIDSIMRDHDASKYSDEEYMGYCNHFYPSEGFEDDDELFQLSWLHHMHNNAHHPEYWIVFDDGQSSPLDMPFEYICEMLCDWSSFQYDDPDSTATQWWEDNRDDMILSEQTVRVVEDLLGMCDGKL